MEPKKIQNRAEKSTQKNRAITEAGLEPKQKHRKK
jgi:hypothetical protein